MATTSTEARLSLLKGLIFVIPLIAGFAVMELGLRHTVTRASYSRARIEAEQKRCQVLVLGASNALRSIAVESFKEPTVNVGDNAQSLYYDLAIAERYVPGMPRLKVVILALSYVTFETEIFDWPPQWARWAMYANLWDIPPQRPAFFNAERWSLTALYGVRMSFSYARKGFLVNTMDLPQAKAENEKALDDLAGRLATDHGAAIHPERARDNLARLDRLAALVQRQGARLVLVHTPTRDSYLKLLSNAVLERNARNLSEFLAGHPKVIYRDYLHDPRFTIDDFSDPVHLSPHGAEKFSKVLDAELVQNPVPEAH